MTDTPSGDSYAPLAVVLTGPIPQPPRDVFGSIYQTVILLPQTSGAGTTYGTGAAEEILPASTKRCQAYVMALDDDIVISDNQSDASNGRGATIPKNPGCWTPIVDSGAVWAWTAAAMAGAQSRVSVISVYQHKG